MIPRTLLILLATAPLLSAQTTLFTDNFDSYTPGETLPSVSWGSVNPSTSSSDAAMEVVLDAGDFFGQGTSNQVLHILDESGSQNTRADAANLSFQVATLEFDFYEVGGVSGTPWRISFGLNSSGVGNVFQATLNSGNPGSYSLDAAHKAQIVVNSSTETVFYGGTSIASMQYQLWIDGVLVTANGGTASNFISGFTAGDSMTAFRITTDTSGLSQEMYIDNVTLYDGAVIPEPSTWALITGLVVGCALIFRRRSK
ncbi:PEP-CTERM sorting domain-containing protein [Cerasicoccus frondis]|uniref:PEP-CTERM sorting domain-containing protein n=1 Tax=Cerasicoccus frondis TaxID=490090 RepID=UPI0028525A13|nr:PEP-CTERM sorting domain-containing protein [Cerasicoccus frondis]